MTFACQDPSYISRTCNGPDFPLSLPENKTGFCAVSSTPKSFSSDENISPQNCPSCTAVWWPELFFLGASFVHKNMFLLDPFYRMGSSLQEEILSVCLCVCLSVCLSVRLSVITFSYFEHSIIWWSRPCNPYIFWKLVMLATSTALFWPSTTEYQPVPPSTDPIFNYLMV